MDNVDREVYRQNWIVLDIGYSSDTEGLYGRMRVRTREGQEWCGHHCYGVRTNFTSGPKGIEFL